MWLSGTVVFIGSIPSPKRKQKQETVWWHRPEIPVLYMLRSEDGKYTAIVCLKNKGGWGEKDLKL